MGKGRNLLLALGACAVMAAPASALPETAPTSLYSAAADSLLEAGRKALAEERYYDALTAFESALVADPGSVEAMIVIGQTHEALGQRSVGLSYYRRALMLEPNNRKALETESLALLLEDRFDAAKRNVERLRRICGEEKCAALTVVEQAIADYKAENASVAAADPKPEPDSGGS